MRPSCVMELFLCIFLFFYVAIAEVLDWFGRADVIEKRYPKVWRFMTSRLSRMILMLFLLGLLLHDIEKHKEYQALTIIFQPPRVPSINTVSEEAPKESPDSLRRKTLKLVYDLTLFWNRRPQPPPNIQQNQTPEEHKAKYDQYWQEAQSAYQSAGFNDRILEIVRQYKSKGIETGFLEEEALQSNRYIGSEAFSGSALNDCPRYWSDVCQLRELAYHVDAQDRPIVLAYEPRK